MGKTLNTCIDDLKKRINYAESCKAAWEAVTFSYKKDGKPFVNMKQGISGATLTTKKSWYNGVAENELTVYFKENGTWKYCSDSIQLYTFITYLKADEVEKLDQSRIMGNVYSYSFEEVVKAVSDHIDYWTRRIAELNNSLDNIGKLEAAMATVKSTYESIAAEDKELTYLFDAWAADNYKFTY